MNPFENPKKAEHPLENSAHFKFCIGIPWTTGISVLEAVLRGSLNPLVPGECVSPPQEESAAVLSLISVNLAGIGALFPLPRMRPRAGHAESLRCQDQSSDGQPLKRSLLGSSSPSPLPESQNQHFPAWPCGNPQQTGRGQLSPAACLAFKV